MKNSPLLLDGNSKPKLRAYLSAERDGENYVLSDPRHVGTTLLMTYLAFQIASRFFDGGRTLKEIHAELAAIGKNTSIALNTLITLAQGLDEALLLDGPSLQAFFRSPIRKPTCMGGYVDNPDVLREQLERLFTAPGGPGLPNASPARSKSGRLRAVLVPHMDYGRGNVTYGWGFKELAEHTDASLFVIVATSHYSPHRFTLTRQHFETPLGIVETDQAYIEKLADAYGEGLFDDPAAHVPEHSIELEVVLLKYLFEKRGPVRIVPLLVGSFGDCVEEGTSPRDAEDVARMIAAMQRVEAAAAEPICYLISGDLAHIGPKFGDKRPLGPRTLAGSKGKDKALMERAAEVDSAGYFEAIAAEGDRRRICGLPPTYLALEAARPGRGRLLNYQQYVHPEGHESVSFASMAFYE